LIGGFDVIAEPQPYLAAGASAIILDKSNVLHKLATTVI
jgi:hypothetical protein